MGLYKNYFRVGQNAGNQLFGTARNGGGNGGMPLSMLISQGVKFDNSKLIT